MKAHLWGYNGQSPGPTIEAVEGDKVRIFVTNKLPEHTTDPLARHAAAERHGWRRRPDAAAHQAGQDLRLRVRAEEERDVHVPPARRRDGADGDGHDGLFRHASARSEASCASTATSSSCSAPTTSIPAAYVPKVMTMTDFNLWTWNSRVFPGIDQLVGAQGRPRARAHRQSHHDQPSDPHARLPFRGDLHRRRLGAGERAMARRHGRRAGRRHARLRVRRRRARRLGDPLPQVASHDERHGPRREEPSSASQKRDLVSAIRKLRARLHADGHRPAWRRWARWKCRCRTTRCR